MSKDFDKIQIYMAANEKEYDKAITWVRDHGYGDTIKEVNGCMDTTDWDGNPIKAFIFLFTAPNGTMKELTKYTETQSKIVNFLY